MRRRRKRRKKIRGGGGGGGGGGAGGGAGGGEDKRRVTYLNCSRVACVSSRTTTPMFVRGQDYDYDYDKIIISKRVSDDDKR